MAQEQNYQVNYTINVDATPGTRQIIEFGEAVGKLVQAKASLTPAVTNIKDMMDEIDRVFRTKNGKKRSFDYRLTIETGKSEEKLERAGGCVFPLHQPYGLHGRALLALPGSLLRNYGLQDWYKFSCRRKTNCKIAVYGYLIS